jgi:hypothetical protein
MPLGWRLALSPSLPCATGEGWICQILTIRFEKLDTSVFPKTSDCALDQWSSNCVGEPRHDSLVILSKVLLCSCFDQKVCQQCDIQHSEKQSTNNIEDDCLPANLQSVIRWALLNMSMSWARGNLSVYSVISVCSSPGCIWGAKAPPLVYHSGVDRYTRSESQLL